jgi:hypothetical protein
VNAWWGSFDLSVGLFSGRPAFYAYAHPAPTGFSELQLEPEAARWDTDLGEFVLDWQDTIASNDPLTTALAFARSAARSGCAACDWDPRLAASLDGSPPPVV